MLRGNWWQTQYGTSELKNESFGAIQSINRLDLFQLLSYLKIVTGDPANKNTAHSIQINARNN